MVTKEQAMAARTGQIFEHVSEKNSDGTPLRVRVMGKCKVWKTRPSEFKLPVKYGMYTSLYITDRNGVDFVAQA